MRLPLLTAPPKMATFWLVLCTLSLSAVYSLDNGVARTPPMGWLAWERFACNIDCVHDPLNCISEKLFMDMADHLVSDGFKNVGYEYVNIDDCWASKERDSEGRLQADPVRFPSGIKALADYVHGKGLKLGIYADCGTFTCGGYPGSGGSYMTTDIKTFAEWGVDMLKMDGCNADIATMPQLYLNISQYLNATGRHIVFSCSWPAYWVANKVDYEIVAKSCNLWRNYNDISDKWDSVLSIIDFYTSNQDEFQSAAGPGHWNDPDMLIIGNYGLSHDEQRAQMAIWAVFAAPLLMSNDLRNLPAASKEILQNTEIIAVNQDKLGVQARQVIGPPDNKQDRVLSKPLSDGSYAVVFFNTGSFAGPHNITVDFKTVGLNSSSVHVRDLFEHEDLGIYENSYTAYTNPSGVVMVTMKPS